MMWAVIAWLALNVLIVRFFQVCARNDTPENITPRSGGPTQATPNAAAYLAGAANSECSAGHFFPTDQ